MVDRTHREFTNDDIARIANTYHAWRGEKISPSPVVGEKNILPSPSMWEGKGGGEYQDIPGFCKSATLEDIRKHGHVLTPGRYVGAEAIEDDGEPFGEKMSRLTATLDEQFRESERLEKIIKTNLKRLGYAG